MTSPEQSNPLGEAPPQTYGTPSQRIVARTTASCSGVASIVSRTTPASRASSPAVIAASSAWRSSSFLMRALTPSRSASRWAIWSSTSARLSRSSSSSTRARSRRYSIERSSPAISAVSSLHALERPLVGVGDEAVEVELARDPGEVVGVEEDVDDRQAAALVHLRQALAVERLRELQVGLGLDQVAARRHELGVERVETRPGDVVLLDRRRQAPVEGLDLGADALGLLLQPREVVRLVAERQHARRRRGARGVEQEWRSPSRRARRRRAPRRARRGAPSCRRES